MLLHKVLERGFPRQELEQQNAKAVDIGFGSECGFVGPTFGGMVEEGRGGCSSGRGRCVFARLEDGEEAVVGEAGLEV